MWYRGLLFALVKRVGALGLGGIVLWQVAASSAPREAQAIVHVCSNAVDVTVDDREFRIETIADTPIVCELRPGRHVLRMSRGGRTLDEQEFFLDPGEEVVLTAWEKPKEQRIPDSQPDQVKSADPRSTLGPALAFSRPDVHH